MAFSMLIVIVGFLMLLDKLGIISSDVWSFFWPLLVIAIGLSMMFNKVSYGHYFDDCCFKGKHKEQRNRSRRSRS